VARRQEEVEVSVRTLYKNVNRTVVRSAVVLVCGALLLGCGSGSAAPSTTTTIALPAESITTTVPASSGTPTTAGVTTCPTASLKVSAASGGIAAGSAHETFALTNDGASTCTVSGYATLSFFGASGAGGAGAGSSSSVTVNKTGAPAPTVTLVAKAAASFSMRYSDEPVGGAGCDTVTSGQMSLPGSAEILAFPVSLTLCGGSVVIGPLEAAGAQTS
jgi:hypothetical protein